MPARRRPLGQVPAGGPAASLREGAVCAVGKDQRWLLPLCTTLLPLLHPLRDALRNQTGLHGATRGGLMSLWRAVRAVLLRTSQDNPKAALRSPPQCPTAGRWSHTLFHPQRLEVMCTGG